MAIHEQFEKELKTIEGSIINVYRTQPSLLDSQVARALSAVAANLKAKIKGRPSKEVKLTDLDLAVFDAVTLALKEIGTIVSDTDLLQCIKLIEKSVPRWTNQYGRQGYLIFVSQYV